MSTITRDVKEREETDHASGRGAISSQHGGSELGCSVEGGLEEVERLLSDLESRALIPVAHRGEPTGHHLDPGSPLFEQLDALSRRAVAEAPPAERESVEETARKLCETVSSLSCFRRMSALPPEEIGRNGTSSEMLAAAMEALTSDLMGGVAELAHSLRFSERPLVAIEVDPVARERLLSASESSSPPPACGRDASAALTAIRKVEAGTEPSEPESAEEIRARSALSKARTLGDGSLAHGKERSRPVFETLNELLPERLSERLAIRELLVPVKGDGTMLPIQDWLTLAGGTAKWTRVEPSSVPDPGRLGPEILDLSVPLSQGDEIPVPFGFGLAAYEIRDARGRQINGEIERSGFGTYRVSKGGGASHSVLLRLVREPDLMAMDAESLSDFRRLLPGVPAPLDRLSAKLLESPFPSDGRVSDEEIRKRAADIAIAFKEEGLVYTTNSGFAGLHGYAGENALAFLNGLGCGSCITLSYQLCARLNQAGIPAAIASGNFARENERSYLGDPGHALVVVLTNPPITFDPTTWTDRSKGFRAELVTPEVRERLMALPDGDPDEAFAIGRAVRAVALGEPHPTTDGHGIRDDLRNARPSAELAAAKRVNILEKELCAALAACSETGTTDSLCAIVRQYSRAFTRDEGDPERALLHDALSVALTASNLGPAEYGQVLASCADAFASTLGSAEASRMLVPYLERLRDPELVRIGSGVPALAALSGVAKHQPTDHSAEEWKEATRLYLDSLTTAITTGALPRLGGGSDARSHATALGELSQSLRSRRAAEDPDLLLRTEAVWRELCRYLGTSGSDLVVRAAAHSSGPGLEHVRGLASLEGMRDMEREARGSSFGRTCLTARASADLDMSLIRMGLSEGGLEGLARSITVLEGALGHRADLRPARDELREAARDALSLEKADIAPPIDSNPVSQFLFRYPKLLPAGLTRDLAKIDRAAGIGLDDGTWILAGERTDAEAARSLSRLISGASIHGGELSLRCGSRRDVELTGALRPFVHALSDEIGRAGFRELTDLESLVRRAVPRDPMTSLLERWRKSHPDSFAEVSGHVLSAIQSIQEEATAACLIRAMRESIPDCPRRELEAQFALARAYIERETPGGASRKSNRANEASEGSSMSAIVDGARTRQSLIEDLRNRSVPELADLGRDQLHFVLDRADRAKEDPMIGYSLLRRVSRQHWTGDADPYRVSPSEAGGPGEEVWRRALSYERSATRSYIRDDQVRRELQGTMSRLPVEGRQRSADFLTTVNGGRLPTAGVTDEVWDRRPYQAGDDYRLVDHKASARSGSLVVKRHRAAPEKKLGDEITVHIDAEMLVSDPREPHSNVRSIYGLLSGAVSEGKRVDARVYFRGALIWARSAEEIARDFGPRELAAEKTGEESAKSDAEAAGSAKFTAPGSAPTSADPKLTQERPLPGEGIFGELWRTGYDVGRILLDERFEWPPGKILFSSLPTQLAGDPRSGSGGLHAMICDDAMLAATLSRFAIPEGSGRVVRGAMVSRPDPEKVTGVVF